MVFWEETRWYKNKHNIFVMQIKYIFTFIIKQKTNTWMVSWEFCIVTSQG